MENAEKRKQLLKSVTRFYLSNSPNPQQKIQKVIILYDGRYTILKNAGQNLHC